MIKGKAKIELFDKSTGENTRSLLSENMVTNAISNIFNPDMSILMSSDFLSNLCVNGTPFGEKLLGGLLLFDNTISEDANNIIVPSGVHEIGHAGSPYSGTNTYRGTYNTNESGAIEGGYRFVWDFASDKANGTINCLSLTSRIGGNTGFHSIGDTDESFFINPSNPTVSSFISNNIVLCRGKGNFLFSPEPGKFISCYTSGNKLRFRTYKAAKRTGIKLSDTFSTYGAITLDSEKELTSSFSVLPNTTTGFVTGDGKLLFIWKSDTEGVVNYVKVNLSTLAFEEQKQITISGATLTIAYPYSAEADGFLYIPLSASKVGKFTPSGLFVRDFELNAQSAKASLLNGKLYYMPYSDVYIYSINGNEVEKTRRNNSVSASNNALIKNEWLKPPYFQLGLGSDSSNSDNSSELYIYSTYLGTINNLAEPIVKTTNSTMKITYDIVNG